MKMFGIQRMVRIGFKLLKMLLFPCELNLAALPLPVKYGSSVAMKADEVVKFFARSGKVKTAKIGLKQLKILDGESVITVRSYLITRCG